MNYDPNVPKELKEIQEWFAGIITQPIDDESHINPIAPSGKPIQEEAKKYIAPSPTLKSSERIELYNQQYWWRLLNTMQTTFPLITRLLGYHQFNDRIAIPFLQKYPSQHYSLSHLGERLPHWIKDEYQGEDKQLLIDSIAIDEAFNESFFAARQPPVTKNLSPEQAFSKKGRLQPHLFLFEMPYDLFSFRAEIQKKDPDFWSNHHFPNLEHALLDNGIHFPKLNQEQEYYFIIYRNLNNIVSWESISKAEYQLLQRFQNGSSIEEMCEWVSQNENTFLNDAQSNLQQWIQKWIARQWITQQQD